MLSAFEEDVPFRRLKTEPGFLRIGTESSGCVARSGMSVSSERRVAMSQSKMSSITTDGFMVTRKAKLYTRLSGSQNRISRCESSGDFCLQDEFRNKMSNLERLKQHCDQLEDSRVLVLRDSNVITPEEPAAADFLVTKQFASSKKICMLARYRQSLKQQGRKKQWLNALVYEKIHSKEGYPPAPPLKDTLISFTQLDNGSFIQKPTDHKRKETPAVVKKYFRPGVTVRSNNSFTSKYRPRTAALVAVQGNSISQLREMRQLQDIISLD